MSTSMKKPHLTALLASAVILAFAPAALAGTFFELEPDEFTHSNDSTATAEVLFLDAGANSISGSAGGVDVDFFALNIGVPGLTSFAISSPVGPDFAMALYDPTGTLYIADDNSGSGGAPFGLPRIVADIQAPGTWFLAISVFPFVPTPVNLASPFPPGFGGGFFGNAPLLPGEVGEFKLEASLKTPGNFLGDDTYTLFQGGQPPLDPPFTLTVVTNPEPGTFALVGLGLLGLGFLAWRRRDTTVRPVPVRARS